MSRIVAVEVDGIQQWILGGTAELRVIRGGSLLLDDAFDSVESVLEDALGVPTSAPSPSQPDGTWSLPVCSSGSATVVLGQGVPVDAAVGALTRHLATALPMASVRIGEAQWAADRPFVDVRREAAAQMRPIVAQSVSPHVPGTRMCTSCGVASSEPASTTLPGNDSSPWHLCPDCSRRGRRRPEVDGLPAGAITTYELSAIGDATVGARWRGYLGTICADGNGIGRRFASIADPSELAAASRKLKADVDEVVHAAISAGVADHREILGDPTADLPVNLLMQAGDDIRLIVPAHVVVTVARVLAGGHADLPACAGAAITPSSVPFVITHELAEHVLDRAKSRARGLDADQPPPQVAFVVSSSSHPTDMSHDPLRASPLAPDQVEALVHAADTLAASTSSLRRAAPALGDGGRVAEREWRLFRARLPDTSRHALDELWSLLGSPDPGQPLPVDDTEREGAHTWAAPRRSPVMDLLFLRQARFGAMDTRTAVPA